MKKNIFRLFSLIIGLMVCVIFVFLGELVIAGFLPPKEIPPHICELVARDCEKSHFYLRSRFLLKALTSFWKKTPPGVLLSEENAEQLPVFKFYFDRPRQYLSSPVHWMGKQVEYNLSEQGYRQSYPKNETAQSAFIFLGDSWVFGDFLKDNETLPSVVASYVPEAKSYNFGMQGAGYNEMLVLLYSSQIKTWVKEKNKIFIFVMSETQWSRSFPQVSNALYVTVRPYVTIKDSKPYVHGNYWQADHFWTPLYMWFYFSPWDEILKFSHRNSVKNWSVLCRQIRLIQQRVKELDLQGRFLVMNYDPPSRSLKKCFEDHQMSQFYPFEETKGVYSTLPDKHPDAKAHQEAGRKLADHLRKYLSDQ